MFPSSPLIYKLNINNLQKLATLIISKNWLAYSSDFFFLIEYYSGYPDYVIANSYMTSR